MQTGRKILNLRRDRKISQQDLARACDITPSALSKIEAGINSPRAHIIWKIAKQLGVTMEYLLDEELPYPYSPYSYRQELYSKDLDPNDTVKMECTREEKAFLEALRIANHVAQEVAMAIPEVSVENLRMIHFLVHHSKISNPTPTFFSAFEKMITAGMDTAGMDTAGMDTKATSSTKKSKSSRKRSAKKH